MSTFIKDMAERALKTAAQTALAGIAGVTLLHEVGWQAVGSMVLLATITSVLTSIVSRNVGDKNSASMIK